VIPPRARDGRPRWTLPRSGCHASPPPDPDAPVDLLIVTFDTTRADHLSCYGYPRETSPLIDRLARDGVPTERPQVPRSTTAPTPLSQFAGPERASGSPGRWKRPLERHGRHCRYEPGKDATSDPTPPSDNPSSWPSSGPPTPARRGAG
jgi:hypothetical protein